MPPDALLPSRDVVPSFATNRGRATAEAPAPGVPDAAGVELAFSRFFGVVVPELCALLPRKVLLTDTDLNEVGFLTVEDVLVWPFPSYLDPSSFPASVSEPPLTLTSVEFTRLSTVSERCLFSISSVSEGPAPFTSDCLSSTF